MGDLDLEGVDLDPGNDDAAQSTEETPAAETPAEDLSEEITNDLDTDDVVVDDAPKDDAPDVFESEADLLKAFELEGYENFAAVKAALEAAQQSKYDKTLEALKLAGLESDATDDEGIAASIIQRIQEIEANAQNNTGGESDDKSQTTTTPKGIEEFLADFGGDEGDKQFYKGLATAIHSTNSNALKDAVEQLKGEVQSHLTESRREMYFLRQYDRAVAEAGDGPIPSVQEVMRALKPDGREFSKDAKTDLFYFERLGDASRNAVKSVIDQHRAAKLPGGMTVQQKAERDANLRKLAIHKKSIRTTPANRADRKPDFKGLSSEDRDAKLDEVTLGE